MNGKRLDRRLPLNALFGEPTRQLLGRTGIHDSAQAHQGMGCATHRAMLTGGVDRGTGPCRGPELRCGPARQPEFGVLGLIPACRVIVILGQRLTGLAYQDRPERRITGMERLPGEVHTAPQEREVGFGQHNNIVPASARNQRPTEQSISRPPGAVTRTTAMLRVCRR